MHAVELSSHTVLDIKLRTLWHMPLWSRVSMLSVSFRGIHGVYKIPPYSAHFILHCCLNIYYVDPVSTICRITVFFFFKEVFAIGLTLHTWIINQHDCFIVLPPSLFRSLDAICYVWQDWHILSSFGASSPLRSGYWLCDDSMGYQKTHISLWFHSHGCECVFENLSLQNAVSIMR